MKSQKTKDKLVGSKVTSLGEVRSYLVDETVNKKLYDSFLNDELVVPNGYLLVLRATAGTSQVVLGLGDVWSESVVLAPATVGP